MICNHIHQRPLGLIGPDRDMYREVATVPADPGQAAAGEPAGLAELKKDPMEGKHRVGLEAVRELAAVREEPFHSQSPAGAAPSRTRPAPPRPLPRRAPHPTAPPAPAGRWIVKMKLKLFKMFVTCVMAGYVGPITRHQLQVRGLQCNAWFKSKCKSPLKEDHLKCLMLLI